jgi:hypothetical protein
MLRVMKNPLREQYEKAQQLGKLAFAERPYFGSPAAPAQAETNASQIWGHINSGFLIGYEYTRWWKESLALRQAAVLGDWSWLNKTRARRDAAQAHGLRHHQGPLAPAGRQIGSHADAERARQGGDRRA